MLEAANCHFCLEMVFSDGMKQSTVPIDQAGRIVLPKDVRDELAIKPGDTLKVSIQGSSVTLTPNKEETGFVRKGQALVFCTTGAEPLTDETVNRILEETRRDREEGILSGFPGAKRKK